jgi:hypothetical protein
VKHKKFSGRVRLAMRTANLIGRGKTRIIGGSKKLSTHVKIEKYEQRTDCYRSKLFGKNMLYERISGHHL